MNSDLYLTWYPVAALEDVPPRVVHQSELLGREMALWRADDGFINVWENRCLHRGLRLSIGVNDGSELMCQYHGWRYASRSAGCTYIPAHPADAPARTICSRIFPVAERYGLIWSGDEPSGEPPSVEALAEGAVPLRGLPINASAEFVQAALSDLCFQPLGDLAGEQAELSVVEAAAGRVVLSATVPRATVPRATRQDSETVIAFFVQPVDAGRCFVRPVGAGSPSSWGPAALKYYSTLLEEFRETVEAAAAELPAVVLEERAFSPLPEELAGLPEPVESGRDAPLRVSVARKWQVASGVIALQLEPVAGQLPLAQPGAHIDVHLPNGLVRQYSITNGPEERSDYRIAVKLEPESRGGSSCLHETVREGDVLAISEPRNNFPLRRDAARTVLIAGGIGITPLLAMAQTIAHDGLPLELHYFAQTEDHLAFRNLLDSLGGQVIRHLGLSPAETGAALAQILDGPNQFEHLYVCGPGPMLDAARLAAVEAGWPDGAVHFEYFKNATDIDSTSTFDIELARSALTLTVVGGESILDVLRENGITMPSSCEQGACGTCSVDVVAGAVDHQDVYLNDSEKAAGDRLMVCVSRAAGDRLILDL